MATRTLKAVVHITLFILGIILLTEQPTAVAKIYQENENRTFSENPLFTYNLYGVYVAAIAFATAALFPVMIQEKTDTQKYPIEAILNTATDILWVVVVIGYAGVDTISEFFGVLVITFTISMISYFMPFENRDIVQWPRLLSLIALTGYSIGIIIRQAQIDLEICTDECNAPLRMAAVILGYMPIITGTFLFKFVEQYIENPKTTDMMENWDVMHVIARILVLVALWQTPFA